MTNTDASRAALHITLPAVRTCIQRCTLATATSHARGQAARRCAEQLVRNGGTPAVAADTAAASRRVGEWIASFKGAPDGA